MTATKARRADRRYRCARCGHTATYENAPAAQARYWFSKHSCRKVEEQALRAVLREEREAAIDRTPKPCHHKHANHQHGTRAAYVLDKCRCRPCSKANVDAETWRNRQKAYGRYTKYVPAGPVREHILQLQAAGMGHKTIAKRAGIGTGTISKIVYGVYAPGTGGRNGNGTLVRPPARRVLRETAEKLYALDPDWNGPLPLADGAKIPAHGTVLRMRALVALGWSQSKLAERLGIQRSNFHLTGCHKVTFATARAAAELYEQLSMTFPPETNQRERIAASRARNYARDFGWLPPLALDDDRLDDPSYEPWAEQDGAA